MTKKVSITLPKSTQIWPKLNEIDVYQPVDKKGRPNGAVKRRFITNMEFNDEDHRKVDAFLKKQLAEHDLEGGKLPWKKDKKTGKLQLVATSGEDYPPPFMDAKGNDVPRSKVKIGGGTVAKINVTVNPYTGFGGGINLYINYVQIIDLKVSKKFEVEPEEGFTYDGSGSDEDEVEAGAPEAPSNSDMDDDIPF
ncbi:MULTISPECIES: hypothetical protein [unclassified Bradyrhizobium]|uniref:hypothetical protein n=1 Tax=unclassified Bradyrhizobium TaxID=2631580 RepID=UPI0029162BC5|nr:MULTISPECIES: hypothetical protein [unclassified Bradyrhizobium]